MTYDEMARKAVLVLERYEVADLAAEGLLDKMSGCVDTDDTTFDSVFHTRDHDPLRERLEEVVRIADSIHSSEEEEDFELVAEGLVTDA